MMKEGFTRSLHCRSRLHCVACRNNPGFAASLERTFGPFTCPLGIAPGTALEEMPEQVRSAMASEAGGVAGRGGVIDRCIHAEKRVGEEQVPCCGGKTRTVAVWSCAVRGRVNASVCLVCDSFEDGNR